MNSGIVESWSNAVFEIYQTSNTMKKLEEEVIALLRLITENPDFLNLLSSSKLDNKIKKNIVDKTFRNSISLSLLNTIKLLIDKSITVNLYGILRKIIYLIDDTKNIKYGILFSAIKLTDLQIKKISKKVSDHFHQEIKLVPKIDTSIIGGIKIRIENQVFDYTIFNQIKNLKNIIHS